MLPITFYPGPSKVYPHVHQWLQDAYNNGVLSLNHRSSACMDITKKAVMGLHEKLNIPQDYKIFFVSSATEGWALVQQSLPDLPQYHYFNGAFGEKWHYYANLEKGDTYIMGEDFGLEGLNPTISTLITEGILCFTQNETSNGTAVPLDFIAKTRKNFPDTYIAIDATSSLGGVAIDFTQIDICLASVQKCFGLPAGLGIFIMSPRAFQESVIQGSRKHYNSITRLADNMKNWQTNYTPNVLGIYLLSRWAEIVPNISETHQILKQRANNYYSFFEKTNLFKPLVQNKNARSETVMVIKGENSDIDLLKKHCISKNIILGNGYGNLKDNTFRIANFPAITQEENNFLLEICENF